MYQQAVQRTPSDSPDLPSLLNNLGNGLSSRYARTGRLEDLEEAIRVFQQAVQRTPPDSPELPSRLSNLGTGLSDRYARTGRLEDLEEAIRVYRQAVQRTPPDSPDLPSLLNNLGTGLRGCYVRTGRLEDLEEGIRVAQQAVQRTPPDSPDLTSLLNNLGTGLSSRYARTGRLEDLEEAIRVSQQAVQRTPPDSPDLPSLLNNLGTGLSSRYARTGRLEDLEEAIRLYQQAVQRTPPDSPDLPSRLNNLGTGLSSRYARTGRLEDLDEAIRVYQQAVQRTPPDSPDLPSLLTNLGNGLSDRHARTGRRGDLEEGRAAYERACERGLDLALEKAVRSGRNWGNWASERSDWREAATAYDHAFRAIDRLLRVQLLRSGWEAWLRETQGLAGQAAYALARDGRLEDAVVALERGRVRLLSESLEQNRRDLERLPELGHGELLERYRQTVGRIQSLQQQAVEAGGLQATLRQSLENARQELDANIEAIRQVGGYEDLLLPPSFEKIRRAVTAAAPLVYLVTTPQGSLALIASENGTGTDRPDRSKSHFPIELLWLDEFREEDLNRLLLEQADDEVTGGYLPGQLGRSDWLKASLEKVLPLLAEKLMGPVAERLRGNGDRSPRPACGNAAERANEVPSGARDLLGGRDLPRIVLIPTGRLNLLPLHATILDEFTVSYTASAMALAVARDTACIRSCGARRLAGVGNPLPGAERLTELRDVLRTAVTAVPETAELAQPRAELARLLDFPVDALMHEGRSLIPLAVQIYAAAGKPGEGLLGLALQWPVSLPHARAELESIAYLLPDGHSRTLYEHEAGRQPLLDALAGANLVHLSCHGQFQPDDPLDSGLLLADGQLTLREIMAPGFTAFDSARLAVLSACQTAIADFRNLPDEAIGLPGGLTQAGVPSVVGTLWSVSDASTALLMVRFYELLLQDKLAPPEALRRAQCWLRDATNADLDAYLSQHEAVALARQEEAERMLLSTVHTLLGPVLKGDPNERPYAHPYYWAPFVFYGAEDPIVKD